MSLNQHKMRRVACTPGGQTQSVPCFIVTGLYSLFCGAHPGWARVPRGPQNNSGRRSYTHGAGL
jgi:hypothetical protein